MATDKIPTRVESAPQSPAHGANAPVGESARAAAEAAAAPGHKPAEESVAAAVNEHVRAAAASGASGPKVTVGDAASAAQAAPAAQGASTRAASADEPAEAASHAGDAPQGFARFGTWLRQTFPNSTHAVIGGACGLVVAIMLFTIGLLKTLVVAIFVIVGVAAGQYIDGDPKIVRIVQELMRRQ